MNRPAGLSDASDATLPAGEFSAWLSAMRAALASRGGMDVACGDCRGCCVSSFYVKVRTDESRTLTRIGSQFLQPGPPGDSGSRFLGFRPNGECHMLTAGNCSIYSDRPETCRAYDCRVFTAAGMTAGEDKPVITARVLRWRFDYPTALDHEQQRAVHAAASFLRQHPVRFPDGHVPSRPSEIAVLAIKVYPVFLDPPGDDAGIKRAIIHTATEFERSSRKSGS